MKNTLIILFLFISTAVGATTYYIDPSGNNANNGSGSSPWKTLTYACSKVTTPGDIIHVNAGTYTEIAQSRLAVGVSIEGAGVTSIILSRVGGSSFTISSSSSPQGTNGNQHISNIKMDGSSLTAYGAVKIDKRSNVEIYNCTFTDFNYYGVWFDGDGVGGLPSIYPTGNKFHDNTVINCAGYFPAGDKYNGDGKGAIMVNGQDGLLIYNNILDQTSRASGSNGWLIKGVIGYNRGVKIYNNTITKAPFDGKTWDFAIEFWMCRGGIEISNNTITGGSIDLSGDGSYGTGVSTIKGSYAYGAWIHDNFIGNTTLSGYDSPKGILIEQSAEDVIIERNHIKNVWVGIYFPLEPKANQTGKSIKNVRISYNILENIGTTDGGVNDPGYGIYFPLNGDIGFTCDNVNVWNNVLTAHTGTITPYYGIVLPSIGAATNVSVRNNIVQGFNEAAVYGHGYGGYTLDYLSIENNLFYNNGNSNLPKYSSLTPTHNTTQNNIISNPLFVLESDFHLQSSSPAIGKGLPVTGLTTDYAGNVVKTPPSIGAYESGSAAPAPISPVYRSSVVQNTTPSLIEMTYDLTLNNTIIPAVYSFSVLVNSVVRTVNSVAISGNKVQLTLSSAIKYADIITIAYAKPASNPVQSSTGGQAISISAQSVVNSLIVPTKDAATVTVNMSISPNHIHRVINILLGYSSSLVTQIASLTPEIILITDLSGKLFIEKLIVTGITNIKIPLNLNSGIYNVQLTGNGLGMASQKIIVY